jgi:hypothetical protein
MNFTRTQNLFPKVPPAAYDELCDFLRQSGSPLTPAQRRQLAHRRSSR